MTIEFEYSPDTTIIGEIAETDESFDHEFGREKRISVEILTIHVVYFHDDMDVDVTEVLRAKNLLKIYEDALIEHVLEKAS